MTFLRINQGQAISLGWNAPTLTDITALVGSDGKNFLPVDDRGKYLTGVLRPLTSAGIFYAGLPTVDFIHSFLSDAQLDTWSAYFGQNVTINHHILNSVGRLSVQKSNAILAFDQNQFAGLERGNNTLNGLGAGYAGVVSHFNIVEVISP